MELVTSYLKDNIRDLANTAKKLKVYSICTALSVFK